MRAHLCQRRPSHPGNPPKILQIQLQTIPPTLVISRVNSRQTLISRQTPKISHERPCASGAPPIPKIPKNPANPAPDNPPNLSSNSRHLSSNAHTSAPAPASPLPSRKSPKILQILLQTIPPILVNHSPSPNIPAPLRHAPPIPVTKNQNPASDKTKNSPRISLT